MGYVSWFAELSLDDVSSVGPLAAHLGELFQAKFPLSAGFVVSPEAFDTFCLEHDLRDAVARELEGLDLGDDSALRRASQVLQELVLDLALPQEVRDAVCHAYGHMNVDFNLYKEVASDALSLIRAGRGTPFVSVRPVSSSGQHASFMNVKGVDALLLAVKKCWASQYAARMLRSLDAAPAVIVQLLPDPEKSGVASCDGKRVMMSSCFGLLEAEKSGVACDSYEVSVGDFILQSVQPAAQPWMYVRDGMTGRTVRRDLTEDKGCRQKLSNEEIVRVARLASSVYDHYRKPMNIEYVFGGGRLSILAIHEPRDDLVVEEPVVEKPVDPDVLELKGASMGIDLLPSSTGVFSQDRCPWNRAEGVAVHKCSVKGVSVCPHFRGVKHPNIVLCTYKEE